ncbi:unnamed protein product [Effrenium voratum]|nr:unnamed protein product [Effrenium voratum]
MLTFARVSIFTAFLRLLSHSKVVRFVIQWFVDKTEAKRWAHQKLKNLQDQGVVYFSKRASMNQINRALQYIEQNEEARWVKAGLPCVPLTPHAPFYQASGFGVPKQA